MAEKDDAPAVPPPSQGAGAATAEPKKQKQPAPAGPKAGKLPPYNVVLLDDDDHSYQYVIEMLGKLFGYNEAKAFRMAEEVDRTGRVIVLTTHKERAELKRDQITSYGADVLTAGSKGSMSAIVEPAPT